MSGIVSLSMNWLASLMVFLSNKKYFLNIIVDIFLKILRKNVWVLIRAGMFFTTKLGIFNVYPRILITICIFPYFFIKPDI